MKKKTGPWGFRLLSFYDSSNSFIAFELQPGIENHQNNLTFAAAKNSYEAVSERDQ